VTSLVWLLTDCSTLVPSTCDFLRSIEKWVLGRRVAVYLESSRLLLHGATTNAMLLQLLLLLTLVVISTSDNAAIETYKKVLPCMKRSWMLKDVDVTKWKYPVDAEAHYYEILNKTEKFRVTPVHYYADYGGPWIENIFISENINKPLSAFNGFIPIFVQWIDTEIIQRSRVNNILGELNGVLRHDVLYITVSQGDIGLREIGRAHPNILVLSAGGYGHVPIPLVRSEILWSKQPKEFHQEIGFFGAVHVTSHSSRPLILEEVNTAVNRLNLTYRQGSGSSWMQDMNYTKFNLAPRGYGRSSFRFAESIQMGRIPIFLYDDIPWIPYQGTDISILTFGFVAKRSINSYESENVLNDLSIYRTLEKIKSLPSAKYDRLLSNLKKVRTYYTYPGAIEQINLFFKDPFGVNGGYLRCINHPKTERCCD